MECIALFLARKHVIVLLFFSYRTEFPSFKGTRVSETRQLGPCVAIAICLSGCRLRVFRPPAAPTPGGPYCLRNSYAPLRVLSYTAALYTAVLCQYAELLFWHYQLQLRSIRRPASRFAAACGRNSKVQGTRPVTCTKRLGHSFPPLPETSPLLAQRPLLDTSY